MNSPERLYNGGLAAAAAAATAMSKDNGGETPILSLVQAGIQRRGGPDSTNLMSLKEDAIDPFGGQIARRLEMKQWQAPATATPGESGKGRTSGAAPVILELCGEAVLDVPLEDRCIGPISLADRPLLVGRRHQPELHDGGIAKEYLDMISRDHFCVAYEGAEFWLLSLTPNQLWRDRDGEAPIQLQRDDLATLVPGDRICLGMGACTASAEAARRRLCWHFRRADSDGPVQEPASSFDGASPRWMPQPMQQSDAGLDETALDATTFDG